MIRKSPRPPRFYTPEQWKEFIDKWQRSGLSQSKFCRQHELTHSAFFRWRNKIAGLESGLSLPKTSPTASFNSLSRTAEKSEPIHKKKYRNHAIIQRPNGKNLLMIGNKAVFQKMLIVYKKT